MIAGRDPVLQKALLFLRFGPDVHEDCSPSQLLLVAGCALHSTHWRSLAFLAVFHRDLLKARAAGHVVWTLPSEFVRASSSSRFPEQQPYRIRTKRRSWSFRQSWFLLRNKTEAEIMLPSPNN